MKKNWKYLIFTTLLVLQVSCKRDGYTPPPTPSPEENCSDSSEANPCFENFEKTPDSKSDWDYKTIEPPYPSVKGFESFSAPIPAANRTAIFKLSDDYADLNIPFTIDNMNGEKLVENINTVLSGPAEAGCGKNGKNPPPTIRCHALEGEQSKEFFIKGEAYTVPVGMTTDTSKFSAFLAYCTNYYYRNEFKESQPSQENLTEYQNSSAYHEKPEVQRLIEAMNNNVHKCIAGAGRNKNRRYCHGTPPRKGDLPSTGSCWSYVKHGLVDAGIMPHYISSTSAKSAGPHLKKVGFKNLMDENKLSSKDAPVGAILVYSGGPHGHIEVKTGASEYTSDYKSSNPRDNSSASGRKLIGVYVKE